MLTQRDLNDHIQRFDEIFGVVASQVCNVNEEVEVIFILHNFKKLIVFLEIKRNVFGTSV